MAAAARPSEGMGSLATGSGGIGGCVGAGSCIWIQLSARATFCERLHDLLEKGVQADGNVAAASAVEWLISASVRVRKTPPPWFHLIAYTVLSPKEPIFMMAGKQGRMMPVAESKTELADGSTV